MRGTFGGMLSTAFSIRGKIGSSKNYWCSGLPNTVPLVVPECISQVEILIGLSCAISHVVEVTVMRQCTKSVRSATVRAL